MRLLLDTHILLWALADDPRLTGAHRTALGGAEAILVSAATIWEIAVKHAAGKLSVDGDIVVTARQAGCLPLPVTWAHAVEAAALPMVHSDPFDRLLIGQARVESLALLTADRLLRQYDAIFA